MTKKTLGIAVAFFAASFCASAQIFIFDGATSYAPYGEGIVALGSAPCKDRNLARPGWKFAKYYQGQGDPGLTACWFPSMPIDGRDQTWLVQFCFMANIEGTIRRVCAAQEKARFVSARHLRRYDELPN